MDANVLTFLFGMVAKGKDFAATKGITVMITTIITVSFSAGVMYTQFNAVLKEVKELRLEVNKIKEDNTTIKSDVYILKGKVDNVQEQISEWMRLYGPVRIKP
jgi:peptidoglycan hydrolase CwlO-like protein